MTLRMRLAPKRQSELVRGYIVFYRIARVGACWSAKAERHCSLVFVRCVHINGVRKIRLATVPQICAYSLLSELFQARGQPMKIDFGTTKATKCLCIGIIGTVPVAFSCASNTHQIPPTTSVKPTPLPAKVVSPTVTPDYFQITEKRDLTDFTLIDVSVHSGPVTRGQLLRYVDAITNQVKPKKGLVIWFYNGDKSFGVYDSRKRNQVSKGLTLGDVPPPVG